MNEHASAYHEARRSYYALISDPVELQQQINLLLSEAADHRLLAGLYSQLGNAYRQQYDQGKPDVLRPAIQAFESSTAHWSHTEEEVEYIRDLNHLAKLYIEQQHYQQAEQAYRQALSLADVQLEPDYKELSATLYNLAQLYGTIGRYDEAQGFGRRALVICEAHFGSDHPYTADGLDCVGDIYLLMERYEAALPLYKRALNISKAELGPGSPETILRWTKLSNAHRYLGHYQQAETLATRALTISELELGWAHPNTEICLDTLIKLYLTTHRYGDAERRYCQTLDILREGLAPTQEFQDKTMSRLKKLITLSKRLGKTSDLSKHPITQGILQITLSEK